jgi:hypothetical protein
MNLYEVFCYYEYENVHQIGIFDSLEKAEEARQQFLLQVEEEKKKYPCPLPELEEHYIRHKVIALFGKIDKKKDEIMMHWYYGTPYSKLCSIGEVYIQEYILNEYKFIPLEKD